MWNEEDEPSRPEPQPLPPNRARALDYTSQRNSNNPRFNAFKHGMFARHLLVPGDDPAELHRFKIGMIRSLNPNDTFQQIIAERVICASWKLKRMEQAEQEMYISELSEPQSAAKSPGAAMVKLMKQGQPGMMSEIERIQKYQQKLESTITRNIQLLGKLQIEGWHLQGIISELAGELIEEEEAELKKIDPEFKPEVLGSGWHDNHDAIHECIKRKKEQEEQAASQPTPQTAPAEINSVRPYLSPVDSAGGSSELPRKNAEIPADINSVRPYLSPIESVGGSSDLLGTNAKSWNEISVEDLRRRAEQKRAAEAQELAQAGS